MRKLFLITTLIILFGLGIILLVPRVFAQNVVGDNYRQTLVDDAQDTQALSYPQFGDMGGQVGLFSLGCAANTCYTTAGKPLHAGAVQETSKYIAQLVTDPPLKTGEYIADVMHNIGIAQPAYAQGIGFTALSPILHIWKAFRNMAYFLFILIFVVVGFMTMFQAKINPQTTVTIQAALPKMLVSLFMITFSYAIAGLVIDLIYLVIYLVTDVLGAFGVLSDPTTARGALFSFNVLRFGWNYLLSPFGFGGDASKALGNTIASALGINGLQGVTSTLAYLIISVAILIALFRTLLALVLAWINIILSVIFAPIQLLLNALPQVNTFGSWLRGLIANAAVFPAVGIMLLLGSALVGGQEMRSIGVNPNTDPADQSGAPGTGWVPPLITNNTGATGSNFIPVIIGLGIIMLLPEVAKMVKEALQVKDGGIGEAVQANLQRGVAPWSRIGGAVRDTATGGMDYYTQEYLLNQKGIKAPWYLWRAISKFART